MFNQDFFRKRFDYFPETGLLTNRVYFARGTKPGYPVGSISPDGRLRVKCRGVLMLVHRVIFVWMTGRWPVEVDHINHDPADNRWVNLREVTHAENHKNRSKSSRNTSGITGVSFDKWHGGKWVVQIMIGRKQTRIGYFTDFHAAVAAREAAERKHGYHMNHGRAVPS